MQQDLMNLKKAFSDIVIGEYPDDVKTKSEKILTLYDVQEDIKQLGMIRHALLKRFESDINTKTNKEVSFTYNKFKLMNDNKLDLIIGNDKNKINCLFSANEVVSVRDYKTEMCYFLDDKMKSIIEQIMPYIRGLFAVIENKDTSNILANDFYDSLKIYLKNIIDYLEINGFGVNIPMEKMWEFTLTNREKAELINFYHTNLNQILKRIFVLDSDVLNKYRSFESKQKVLKIYKRGIK